MKNILTSTFIPDTIFGDTPEGQPVSIDFRTLVGEHTLVAAQNGSGKSILLRKTEELALASNHPIIILDSDGGSASLREVAPNGLLVFGGRDGDPEITLDRAVGQLPTIIEARNSVVFDICALDDDGRAIIVSRVLSTMLRLPAELHQPYLVVIDEVQRFAPQRGVTEATDAIIKGVKEGRKTGLSVLVATQRIADISKALTSQTRNKLFGHVSDAADRKRYAEELGISRQAAALFGTFEKGDFLVQGEAFGGPVERLRVRLPVSGRIGKDHLLAKLQAPIVPADLVRAKLLAGSSGNRTTMAVQPARSPSGSDDLREDVGAASDAPSSDSQLELVLRDILRSQGKSGMAKDMLALLAGTTERRREFSVALSNLFARKEARMGTGTKVHAVAAEPGDAPSGAVTTAAERLTRLRSQRDASDGRVVSCLSAAGHALIGAADIQTRTGLGPRVLKRALQRLKRDGWVVERRGSFATAPALARLMAR